MTDAITPGQFSQAPGVSAWQADAGSARAVFQTGSFTAGVAFVAEIGRLADSLNHHPDVTLTYPAVAVRVTSHDVDGLSERDVALAQAISVAAQALGYPAATA